MGCAAGKLEMNKVSSSAVLDDSYFKIQTVLKVEPLKKSRNHRRSHSRSSHKKRRDSKNCRGKECSRHKHAKGHHPEDKIAKTTYDTRITAKYIIKALIGKGTFSRVLRVEHRISKQPFALKMIEAPGGREVFEAELSILRRVNHPNVIKLIEVFESNNKVYMVMELATGGNLLDRLETKGTLSEDDARYVMQMVLSGVKYLHTLGITHRDLKPDNLLYYHPGKDSKVMITDFGLASTRKPSGSPYMCTICGTPQYIAPEIVAQKPYTCAVDMWAIGVITYIVLCGAFPFDAEHDAQIFKLILKGKVNMSDSVWANVSKDCKSFIHYLLKHDPSQRLTADAAFKHSWISSSLPYAVPSSSRKNSPDHRDHSQRSARSVGSSHSSKSISSLRSGHRRVQACHLEALSTDPEAAALMQ